MEVKTLLLTLPSVLQRINVAVKVIQKKKKKTHRYRRVARWRRMRPGCDAGKWKSYIPRVPPNCGASSSLLCNNEMGNDAALLFRCATADAAPKKNTFT